MLKDKILYSILFIASTSFFLLQWSESYAWDFKAYVLNAHYLFGDGNYFELARPPLAPLIMGMFLWIGEIQAQIIFIILVSAIFGISNYLFSKKMGYNESLWYALSLSPFVLTQGLAQGTELLSLSLLQLFVVLITHKNAFGGGIALGLAILTRYNYIPFALLTLGYKNLKKIIIALIISGAVMLPWMYYNYIFFGNFFASIADGYASNIAYRGYIKQPIEFEHFIALFSILTPFFVLGAIRGLIKIIKKRNISQIALLSLFVSVITIYIYSTTPIKIARYLFPLSLIATWGATEGATALIKNTKREKITRILIIALMTTVSFTIAFYSIEYIKYTRIEYQEAKEKLIALNMSNCSIASNGWVVLNYLGFPAIPAPRETLLEETIEEGTILVLFNSIQEPDYKNKISLLNNTPTQYESQQLIIKSKNKCIEPKKQHYSFREQIFEYIKKYTNQTININPCFILFRTLPITEKICNFINGNGFKIDENRILE